MLLAYLLPCCNTYFIHIYIYIHIKSNRLSIKQALPHRFLTSRVLRTVDMSGNPSLVTVAGGMISSCPQALIDLSGKYRMTIWFLTTIGVFICHRGHYIELPGGWHCAIDNSMHRLRLLVYSVYDKKLKQVTK